MSKISIKISSLQSFDRLVEGKKYKVQVKAKAKGYLDSDLSLENIIYTKPVLPTLETVSDLFIDESNYTVSFYDPNKNTSSYEVFIDGVSAGELTKESA